MSEKLYLLDIPGRVADYMHWYRTPYSNGTPEGDAFVEAHSKAERIERKNGYVFRILANYKAALYMIMRLDEWRNIQSDDRSLRKSIRMCGEVSDKIKAQIAP